MPAVATVPALRSQLPARCRIPWKRPLRLIYGRWEALVNINVDGTGGRRGHRIPAAHIDVDVNGSAHVHVGIVETGADAIVPVATMGEGSCTAVERVAPAPPGAGGLTPRLAGVARALSARRTVNRKGLRQINANDEDREAKK